MPYQRNTWARGDTITSAKLNHLESGLVDIGSDIEDAMAELDAALSTSFTGALAELKAGIPTNVRNGTGEGSIIEGLVASIQGNVASGQYAHAEGFHTTASGRYSHVEGYIAEASADRSHAEGDNTSASGITSHAEGAWTEASGLQSHAEGDETEAQGDYSHAEGQGTIASGTASHAEGMAINDEIHVHEASGDASHVEGCGVRASGDYAHGEGYLTHAKGLGSHAEGVEYSFEWPDVGSGQILNSAAGRGAHAEGGGTTARGDYSHAEGVATVARHMAQHVFGAWNSQDPSGAQPTERGTYIEIVGNGSPPNHSHNARTLDWDGNETLAGSLTLGKGTADEVTLTAAQLKRLLAMLT